MDNVLQQIADAIKDAVRHCEQDGVHPSEGLAKAAKDHGLNLEKTKRAVEGFNTLKFLENFKSAEDKAQDFPIANPADVISAVENIAKMAGLMIPTSLLEYMEDERDYRFGGVNYNVPLDGIDKAAVVIFKTETPYSKDINLVMPQALSHVSRLEKTAEVLEMQALACKDRVSQCVMKLAEYFSSPYNQPFNEFEAEAKSVYENTSAVPILNMVYKAASHRAGRATGDEEFEFVNTDTYPHQLLKEALFNIDHFARLTKKAKQVANQGLQVENKISSMVSNRLGYEKKAAKGDDDGLFGGVFEPLLSPAKGIAENIGKEHVLKALGTSRERGGKIWEEQMKQRMSDARMKPEEQLGIKALSDQMKRKKVFEGLIATDEILKEIPAEQLADAYQAMIDLSPKASMQKEVVRSVLRQASSQMAIDPFMAEQLAKLEQRLSGKTVRD